MNNGVKEGDTVKAIGNHCWRGREGIVEQVEDVEGTPFVHAIMDNNEKIIMRTGQYKVTKKGDEEPAALGTKLVDEVIPHIQRVVNNKRYSLGVRQNFVKRLRDELLAYVAYLSGPNAE